MLEEQGRSRVPEQAATKKKPYVKPAIISEPIYETTALACSKLPGQGGRCHGPLGHPHSS
jgi:hypothetical protein